MTEVIAKESVGKAKQLNMNTARIVIPDTKDAVSETRIELPKVAVKELNDDSLKLEISTENVVISVPTNSIAGFIDVSADLWAFDTIAYVQSTGLMSGYNDDTFKPDSKLTRAEAVKVLNVLFKRTPATGVTTPSFTDVPAIHWAYEDIEAAAQK
ncbi:S-layer homology domain-containing protein [Paenibacillus sp. Z3-2]